MFSDPPPFEIDRVNAITDDYSPLSRLEPISFHDPFNRMFPTDEIIIEIMNLNEMPWDNCNQRSYFLPILAKIENDFYTIFASKIIDSPEFSMSILQTKYERNFGNISTNTPIDISVKSGIIENIHICASFSLEEIET